MTTIRYLHVMPACGTNFLLLSLDCCLQRASMSVRPSAPALHGSPQHAGLPMDVCAKMVTVRDNRKEGAQTCNNAVATPKCSQPSSSP